MDQASQKQHDRAYLRERTLQAWFKLKNQPVDVKLISGSETISVSFRSVQADEEVLHVSDLQTPLGCVSEALLRGNDVEQLCFRLTKVEPETQAPKTEGCQ
eukprot:m.790733 g.790733  ORF g.790733 m.790733 type:complete len:101 (-) comp23326_c0_seq46:4587-4889(-)